MIFDESEIESIHQQSMTKGGCGEALMTCVTICIDLIRHSTDKRDETFSPEAHLIVLIGGRLVVAAGAAGRLLIGGYWAPSLHMLRDIVETGQLLEYLQHRPEKAEVWRTALGKDRYKSFSFGRLKTALEHLRGPSTIWSDRFDEYSNFGSHVSIEGLAVQLGSDDGITLGPYEKQRNFRLFLLFLSADMVMATLQFERSLNEMVPQFGPISSRLRMDHLKVHGAHQLLTNATAQEWIDNWR